MNENSRLLSIIIVAKDNQEQLAKTLYSIRSQFLFGASSGDLASLEVVIVDSSTRAIPEEFIRSSLGFLPSLVCLRQYPPAGVYAAMNLGLKFSGGQIVTFLNSGDAWAASPVLSSVIHGWFQSRRKPTILFGQALICPLPCARIEPWLVPDPAVFSIRKWLKYYCPNHQSVFVDGTWARSHPFCLDAPHSADRAWIQSALADNHFYVYMPTPFVEFYLGGLSSRLPDWQTLRLRLSEPSRTKAQKFSEIIKFVLKPFEGGYPLVMKLRSRFIGLIV
jgi:glycosyltransferase involved in cell wall biosynthesis